MPGLETQNLLWLIPGLPLLGFVVNGLLALVSARSKRGPEPKLAALFGIAAPLGAFIVALICIAGLLRAESATGVDGLAWRQTLWSWMASGSWSVDIGLLFDHLTALMCFFVLGIGTLIHIYSAGYMVGDRGYARFFAYLNLFTFSMVVLVMADNALLTFLGWEGVGLCSYLLIGFWHKDHANNDAARKAFIVNRIGDLGVLLGLFALAGAMMASGSPVGFNWEHIAAWASDHVGDPAVAGSALLTASTLLLFLGCTGKSAQLPLFTWLPDAMAGPTPVSALIHAATMVTAGIYLCARAADLFVLTPMTMSVILVVAIATALYAALIGLVQWDIKKILAYSTVSQLGFMFMAVGVGAFDVALFHVLTHAFFKATLFLGAGSVIHALHHEQDTRRMGGLAKQMPYTHMAMFFAWYAIIGLPLGSGFMSKDLILERLFVAPGFGMAVYALALVAAVLTAVYMTRFMFLVFWSPARPAHPDAEGRHQLHAPGMSMQIPLVILGIGSIAVGGVWVALIPGVNFLERWLAPVLEGAQETLHDGGAEHHPPVILLAVLGVSAAVVGAAVAWSRFRRGPADATVAPLAAGPATLTWAFDRFYQRAVVAPLALLARVVHQVVDRLMVGGAVESLANMVTFIGSGYQGFQRSRLRTNLAIAGFAMVVIIGLIAADLLVGGA